MAALFFAIAIAGLILSRLHWFSIEITGVILVAFLLLTGCATETDVYAAISNPYFLLLISLTASANALSKSGSIDFILRKIFPNIGENKLTQLFSSMLGACALSSLVPNSNSIAAVIPAISLIGKDSRRNKNWLLLPLALMIIIGGTISLLGSVANIFGAAILSSAAHFELGMFSQSQLAIIVAACGFIYLLVAAPSILSRNIAGPEISERYELRSYAAEIEILPESPLCGLTLGSSPLFREVEITVLSISRDGNPAIVPQSSFSLKPRDKLVVEGNVQRLTDIIAKYSLRFLSQTNTDQHTSKADSLEYHELVLGADSPLCYRTPAEVLLRPRYRMSLLAINRAGTNIREHLSRSKLLPGDVLLVQFLGHPDYELIESLNLIPLEREGLEKIKLKSKPFAAIIYGSFLLLAALKILPLWLSMLTCALAISLVRQSRALDFSSLADWKSAVAFACFFILSRSFSNSGAQGYLLTYFQEYSWLHSKFGSIFAICAFTMFCAELFPFHFVLALLMPIAVSISTLASIPANIIGVAVIVSCSCSFLTLRQPELQLVFGAGNYSLKTYRSLVFGLSLVSLVAIVLATYYVS